MKVRYAESFLFPNSQLDFKRSETFYGSQGLHGLGATEAEYADAFPDTYALIVANRELIQAQIDEARAMPDSDPMKDTYVFLAENRLQQTYAPGPYWNGIPMNQPKPVAAPVLTKDDINAAAANYIKEVNVLAESSDAAARDAAGLQTSAGIFAQAGRLDVAQDLQQRADIAAAEAAAKKTAADNMISNSTEKVLQRATDIASTRAGSSTQVNVLPGIIQKIDVNKLTSDIASDNAAKAAASAAAATQTTAVNKSTGTVQTKDTSSGVTTTANGSTGQITQKTATGQIVTGAGSVSANGVITTVDQNTGIVTTQNTRTGVVTQTDSTTGKTVTAVQILPDSSGGGTFMIPDTGKVVTTKIPIMGGSDAGKLALVGLLGLLLLRGAVR